MNTSLKRSFTTLFGIIFMLLFSSINAADSNDIFILTRTLIAERKRLQKIVNLVSKGTVRKKIYKIEQLDSSNSSTKEDEEYIRDGKIHWNAKSFENVIREVMKNPNRNVNNTYKVKCTAIGSKKSSVIQEEELTLTKVAKQTNGNGYIMYFKRKNGEEVMAFSLPKITEVITDTEKGYIATYPKINNISKEQHIALDNDWVKENKNESPAKREVIREVRIMDSMFDLYKQGKEDKKNTLNFLFTSETTRQQQVEENVDVTIKYQFDPSRNNDDQEGVIRMVKRRFSMGFISGKKSKGSTSHAEATYYITKIKENDYKSNLDSTRIHRLLNEEGAYELISDTDPNSYTYYLVRKNKKRNSPDEIQLFDISDIISLKREDILKPIEKNSDTTTTNDNQSNSDNNNYENDNYAIEHNDLNWGYKEVKGLMDRHILTGSTANINSPSNDNKNKNNDNDEGDDHDDDDDNDDVSIKKYRKATIMMGTLQDSTGGKVQKSTTPENESITRTEKYRPIMLPNSSKMLHYLKIKKEIKKKRALNKKSEFTMLALPRIFVNEELTFKYKKKDSQDWIDCREDHNKRYAEAFCAIVALYRKKHSEQDPNKKLKKENYIIKFETDITPSSNKKHTLTININDTDSIKMTDKIQAYTVDSTNDAEVKEGSLEEIIVESKRLNIILPKYPVPSDNSDVSTNPNKPDNNSIKRALLIGGFSATASIVTANIASNYITKKNMKGTKNKDKVTKKEKKKPKKKSDLSKKQEKK